MDNAWVKVGATPLADSTVNICLYGYRSDCQSFYVQLKLTGNTAHDCSRIAVALEMLDSFRTCECASGKALCSKHEETLKSYEEKMNAKTA